jgi:hypothetical protein
MSHYTLQTNITLRRPGNVLTQSGNENKTLTQSGRQTMLFYSHRMNFYALPSDNRTIIEARNHCAFYSTRFRNIPWPYLLAAMILALQPLLLLLVDRNELTGTSQPNSRGTLLPPQPPEPQRGHTQPESN